MALEKFGLFPDELLQRADGLPGGGGVELVEIMAFYNLRAEEYKRDQPKGPKRKGVPAARGGPK